MHHKILLALAVGLVIGTPASGMAQSRHRPAPSPRPEIPPQIEALLDDETGYTNVSWRVLPSPSVNDFPQRAFNEGLSGSATLACIAPADGVIRFCKVLSETPEGYGFGESAINIVARARIQTDPDPKSIRVFRVRMPFNLG